MTLASCIYEGELRHRRRLPLRHDFRYRLFLMYVDLDELDTAFAGRWLWSVDRPNLAWFRRADHFGSAAIPLAESIRTLVEEQAGRRPTGPIRLLTHFRYAGFAMNPISLYYCFDERDQLEHVVAEVNNTPWGERHCYVLGAEHCESAGSVRTWHAGKALYVSPFFAMDYDYRFRLTVPGRSLAVSIDSFPQSGGSLPTQRTPAFHAMLRLRRRPLESRQLARVLVRYPCLTGQVFARIYWQAWRLWRRGVPFVPHPGQTSGNRAAANHGAQPGDAAKNPSHDVPQTVSR